MNWTDGKGGHISVSKDGKQTNISGVSGAHIGETRTYSVGQSSSKDMPNFGPGFPFNSPGTSSSWSQGSVQVNIKDSSNVSIHGQKIIGDKKGNFSGIVSSAQEKSKESNRSKEVPKSNNCRIM